MNSSAMSFVLEFADLNLASGKNVCSRSESALSVDCGLGVAKEKKMTVANQTNQKSYSIYFWLITFEKFGQ